MSEGRTPRTRRPRARLADLARKAGQGERARELYERSLAIAQRPADDKPGNTTYRRDLSVSFNKLADLAREAGQCDEARQWASRALDIQRWLVRDDPDRLISRWNSPSCRTSGRKSAHG